MPAAHPSKTPALLRFDSAYTFFAVNIVDDSVIPGFFAAVYRFASTRRRFTESFRLSARKHSRSSLLRISPFQSTTEIWRLTTVAFILTSPFPNSLPPTPKRKMISPSCCLPATSAPSGGGKVPSAVAPRANALAGFDATSKAYHFHSTMSRRRFLIVLACAMTMSALTPNAQDARHTAPPRQTAGHVEPRLLNAEAILATGGR